MVIEVRSTTGHFVIEDEAKIREILQRESLGLSNKLIECVDLARKLGLT